MNEQELPHTETHTKEPIAALAPDDNKSSSTNNASSAIQPLSKNQQKKRARYEKALANKKRRKDQEREIRILKAEHSGRDLEKEREQQLKNEQDGKGWERREELWKQKLRNADTDHSFKVCFDCSFEDQMTSKEINSLSLQLRYVYSRNRKSLTPVTLDVCSLPMGCETRSHLEKVVGFPDSWKGRAFNTYETGIDEVYGWKNDASVDDIVKSESNPKICEVPSQNATCDFQPTNSGTTSTLNRKLVYLTGDSANTISTLDNNTTYIIGGIVDRNRLKRAAINRAEKLNIPTARLPLDENLDFKGSTRVLTCNHVFEILLKFRENRYEDWKGAILSVLPGRKEVQAKDSDKMTTEDHTKTNNK
jgi:Trm5-related predicted tRNA methylase